MRQLSPLDSLFVFAESPRCPMHIGSVALYDPSTIPDGGFSMDRMRRYVETRLGRAHASRERLLTLPGHIDYPYWVDDDEFDLDDHVRHIALPAPGGWQQLWNTASWIFAQQLDMTRPLWEFWFIEGLHGEGLPEGGYAIIGKVHHAAVDGLSGIQVMAVTHDLSPDEPVEADHEPWSPKPLPGQRELLRKAAGNAVRAPWQIVKRTARIAAGLRKGLGTIASNIGTPDGLTVFGPRTRFNQSVSRRRNFRGVSYSLAEIRELKDRAGKLKVNDVALAICAGALRRYLLSKGELPDRSLLAMVPVSVRDQGQESALGNQVSTLAVPLPVHIESARGRLHFEHDAQVHRKQILDAVGRATPPDLATGTTPSALLALTSRLYIASHLADDARPIFNTVITNVPGPQFPLYNCGARMLDMYGLVPLFDSSGLGHVVSSYCGSLTISFVACSRMLPDPDFYAECLRESFEELKREV